MSLHHLGATRSRSAADHLLHTPDSFVYTALPGMECATAAIHIAPVAGAAFTQYTAVLERDGLLGAAIGSRFLYVLGGTMHLDSAGQVKNLRTGEFAFIPQGQKHTLRAHEPARAVVIEKTYVPMADVQPPASIVSGAESQVAPRPLNGDEAIQVQALLPAEAAFDFAVNLMTYQPGARLSQVEIHVMEHGLLMLEGEGIYRLGDAWYPVTAGDFIWMAPFCPQWFGALGPVPTRYLIYKDWNRHPLDASSGERMR